MLVKLKTYDGQEYVQEIAEFNLVNFIDEVNNANGGSMVKFGDVGVMKSLIQVVDTRQGVHSFES